MDARLGVVFEGFPSAIDIRVIATGEAADGRAMNLPGYFPYGFEIPWLCYREPSFDDIDA